MARPIIRTCCCCDLRTGVILIALFSMGIAAVNIYTGIKAVHVLEDVKPNIQNERHELPIPLKYYDDAINVGWSNIAFFASDVFISIVLLIAAIQRNKCLLTTWIVWTGVCVLYHLSVTIFFLVIWRGVPTFGYAMIIDLIIVAYFLLVVYSFKQEIAEQETGPALLPQMSFQVVGQPTPDPYPSVMPHQPYGGYPQQSYQHGDFQAPPPYMQTVAQAPPPYAEYQQGNQEKMKL